MNPEGKTEEQLATELEAMYKLVAESEKPGTEAKEGGATIPPDIYESPAQTVEAQKVQERASDYLSPPPVKPISSIKKQHYILIAATAVFVCLCVMLYAVFFWPTLYEVATIKAGNNSYPVRINRITGNVIYFDGEQWRETPIPAPALQVSQAPPASPELPVKTSEGTESSKRTLSQEQGAVQTPQRSRDQAYSAGLPSKDIKKKESTDSVSISAKEKPFAIQVKAFNNWPEAQTALAAIKKTGVDAHYVTVPLGDRGTWYRILIGRFKDPVEAMQFMKKKRMEDFYEGCFIQKYP